MAKKVEVVKRKRMMELLQKTWQHLRTFLRPAILFQLWYSLLYVVFYAPLSAWLLRRLVGWGGQLAWSNHELVAFFLSARGLAFILLSAGFALALFFIELVGLLALALYARWNQQIAVSEILWRQITYIPSLVWLGLLQVAGYGAILLPIIGGLALTYGLLLGDRDINYYLMFQPWQWWTALAIAAGLVIVGLMLATWLFVRWLFAIPALVFEQAATVQALRLSWQRTRSFVLSYSIPLVLLSLGVLAAVAATTWLIHLVASPILLLAGLNLSAVLPTVLVALAITSFANIAWIFIGKALAVTLIVGFYLEKAAPQGQEAYQRKARPAPARLGRLGWLAVVLVSFCSTVLGMVYLEKADLNRNVAVTAHRGSSLKAPENTMSAVQQAVADGADFAEIDVQTTADGVVVLVHDADLMRIAGDHRTIEAISYKDLKELDIGSWFAPAFSAERIATLDEVMEYAKGRIKLNIELKYNRPDSELANKVGQIIRKKKGASQCIVTSLDYQALRDFRTAFPETPVGLIIFEAVGRPTEIQVDFLSLSARQVNTGFVRRARSADKTVHVWTVNDAPNALTMLELGVDNIITDNPAGLRQLIHAWQRLSDTQKIALMLRNLILVSKHPVPENL